jgi:hypothetical protein
LGRSKIVMPVGAVDRVIVVVEHYPRDIF